MPEGDCLLAGMTAVELVGTPGRITELYAIAGREDRGRACG